jgi:hypothetical protein
MKMAVMAASSIVVFMAFIDKAPFLTADDVANRSGILYDGQPASRVQS